MPRAKATPEVEAVEPVEPKEEEVKPEAPVEPAAPEVKEEVVVEKPKKAKAKTSFLVRAEGGNYVRTYTVEKHGEDAGKLAETFAGKIGGTVQ